MDINKIQCLVDKGLITQDDANTIMTYLTVTDGNSSLLQFLSVPCGNIKNEEVILIRPANTTQYTAGDLVAAAGATPPLLQFNVRKMPAAGVMIRGASIASTSDSILNASYRLHLFVDPSVTALNISDNSPINTATNISAFSHVGSIDITMSEVMGASSIGHGSVVDKGEILLQGGAQNPIVYGMLEVTNDRTPKSSEVFYIKLDVLQS